MKNNSFGEGIKKKSGTKNVNIQEILCLAILVVLAIAMLANFTRNSRKELRNLVENGIMRELETCSARITADMDKVTGTVMVANRVFEDGWPINDTVVENMLSVIPDSCKAYLAVYCKLDGSAITSGGEKVDLRNTEYFSELRTWEPFFIYVEDDGVTGENAIMYAHPVIRNDRRQGYILAFLPREFPVSVIEDSTYETIAFFAIAEREGRPLLTYGDTGDTKLLEDDFWSKLREERVDGEDWQKLERMIHDGRTDYIYINDKKGQRLVGVTPLKETGFLLVMGLQEEYVSDLERSVWDKNSRVQLWICGILLGILVVIIVFNTRNRQRNKEESRQLENKADTDLLTGLNNKIATERKITEYMQQNPDSQAMMVVLDIDNFKKINDTLGHGFGDEVLRNLGHRLSAMFRSSDILGRLGGDEFVILLKDIKDDAHIKKEAKKLEDFFHHFEVGEYVKYSVTASLGAAVFPRDANTFEGMYKAADTALYTAKRRGKNQLAFYEKRKADNA